MDLERLKARAAEIADKEGKELLTRTTESEKLFQRALKSLPNGVVSNFQTGDPYPVYLERGKGSTVTDVDGTDVQGLPRRVRRERGWPRPPEDRRGPQEGRRERDPLRGHHARHGRAGRGDLRALPARADAVRELGHRGHDGRAARRAGRDRPRQDHQDGGVVPRPPRLGAVLGRARGRRARAAAQRQPVGGRAWYTTQPTSKGDPSGTLGHRDRRAVQRRDRRRASLRGQRG